MATGTPFHPRTESLCRSYDWRQWSGYLAVGSYNDFVQPEYAAIRNAAALIDISPLYKYWVSGRDAVALIDRIVTQHAGAMKPGQVTYAPWLDADGKVRQDGTVFRLADDCFKIAAAEPAFDWIRRNAVGFDVEIRDRSADFAALSLQGPHSRPILVELCGERLAELGFFRSTQAEIAGAEVLISRTGYTGDLGYEIWLPSARAVAVWDALATAGDRWQLTPCGLAAMDVARVEAGFILIGVDYVSAEFAHLAQDKVSPYEIGLGWTVKLGKGNFIGRQALLKERARGGPSRRLVGLQIDWETLERTYLEADLMPDLPMTVCREPIPVYSDEGLQVGRVTSRVWSKLLKSYIALATVDAAHAELGGRLHMEVTVHYRRRRVQATVVTPAFFRPQRMRA